VISPSEAKAYVDQSLTGAVGVMTISAGSVADQQSEHAFGNSHSYEWDSQLNNPILLNFYNTLMGRQVFNLPIIPSS
jgi:hypothetical protein